MTNRLTPYIGLVLLSALWTSARARGDETDRSVALPERVRVAAHTPWVRTLDVSHDGRFIATGGPDKATAVWRTGSKKRLALHMLPSGPG